MSIMPGKRIILRELRKEDYPDLHSWKNDPDITKYLSARFYPPITEGQSEQLINDIYEGKNKAFQNIFMIEEISSGGLIGEIVLFDINWIYSSCEMAIVLWNKKFHGKGFGQEAISLILEHAFGKLNLNRVMLHVHEDNEVGISCYRKSGFTEEGRLRKSVYKNGKYRDMVVMGILREEFSLSTSV